MIQILTYNGNDKEYQGNGIKVNSFHDAESLDSYDANVIILNNEKMWANTGKNKNRINSQDDLKSLCEMLENCHKSRNVIVFPQNLTFKYNLGMDTIPIGKEEYLSKCELKNMITEMLSDILNDLYKSIDYLHVVYENTRTKVGNKEIPASFYFNGEDGECLTKSIGSEKRTTIDNFNMIFSTLELKNAEEIILFLKYINVLNEPAQDCPEWVENISMFDDEKQIEIIRKNEQLIIQNKRRINDAQRVLDRNNRYKSILYTNGDELVEVVFEIFKEMLGWDLSEFQDKKKEDFNVKTGEKIFIGEIKGITTNVKKANVSQLDVHVQEYLDENESEEANIISLLVINHQRNKPLEERESVMDDQIKLAERNGSLIVETVTLLRMFEKYLNKDISREECINLLSKNKGLLEF